MKIKTIDGKMVDISVPNTFTLWMYESKEDYESEHSSLSIELDTVDECIENARTIFKENSDDFYKAVITNALGEVVWYGYP